MTEENCPNCGNEDCPEPSYDLISRAACERRAKEAALRELARCTASFAEIAELQADLATERAKAEAQVAALGKP